MVRSRAHRTSAASADDSEGNLTQTQVAGDGAWVVGMDCRSMNLYRFLRVQLPGASRGLLRRWIAEGLAQVNGEVSPAPLRTGDVVSVDAATQALPRDPKRKPLAEVLFEDEALLAVSKPAGLATVPERQSRRECLLDSLKRERAEPGLKLVHRLDKHASGVVVFAKDRNSKRKLIEQFSERRVTKDYLALVSGQFTSGPERLEDHLVPIPGRRPRMAVRDEGGKHAITLVRPAFRFRGFAVVHARPVTGRTHQIRVQLQYRGYTLVGDEVYGGDASLYLSKLKSRYRPARGETEKPLLDRMALHAGRIRLQSPTGEALDIRAPLTKDLTTTFKQLQKIRAQDEAEAFAEFLREPFGNGQDPFEGMEGVGPAA